VQARFRDPTGDVAAHRGQKQQGFKSHKWEVLGKDTVSLEAGEHPSD